MTGDEPEGFLGRWSRVKRTSVRSAPEFEPAPAPAPAPDPETSADLDPKAADAPQARDDAPVTLSEEELAALPRIEDLVPGSDIRPFLRLGVPRDLRNAAMRKIWMLTPGIRDYKDPAVDYAWDWNTPGGVPGDGVAPTPERAAEMLKSLLAPRPQKDASDAAGGEKDTKTDRAVHADHADPEAAEDMPDTPQDPLEEAAIAQDSPAVDDMDDGLQADLDGIARRRHGSALPS